MGGAGQNVQNIIYVPESPFMFLMVPEPQYHFCPRKKKKKMLVPEKNACPRKNFNIFLKNTYIFIIDIQRY